MAVVLGVNAVFHDPAAAVVRDGEVVAACEEERLSRRKHGKSPVPFSTWELPEAAIAAVMASAGVTVEDLDAVAYSYDPTLVPRGPADLTANGWEELRTLFARRAPRFLATALDGLDPQQVRFVAHHVAHAASAWGPSPFESCAVMVLDGRGERSSYLAGVARNGAFHPLAGQDLPHSLGLRYEELTEHLGFHRSSDEYKVMALASYGTPRWLEEMRHLITTDGGAFRTEHVDWSSFVPAGRGVSEEVDTDAADLACSVQTRLEEVILELAAELRDRSGECALAMAGGVALNCVANRRLWDEGPFERVWVQPAAGDAGTALGAAVHVAATLGDRPRPMTSAALGPVWTEQAIEADLRRAAVPYRRPADLADEVAEVLARDGLVAWFQGRSEFGPRALGHRSLLAHPGHAPNVERLNDVKGREQFRPVAPMVLLEAAEEVFEDGPLPSPYMLFTHQVRAPWRDRVPAVVHVDGSARPQTVSAEDEPLVHRMIDRFRSRTGLPVVVNTSLNTAGRPMVETPREALELAGSSPIDVLAMGPFLIERPLARC